MDNEKYNLGEDEAEFESAPSTRARNRTVMLTPDITGQVRARIQTEGEAAGYHSRAIEQPAVQSSVMQMPPQAPVAPIAQPTVQAIPRVIPQPAPQAVPQPAYQAPVFEEPSREVSSAVIKDGATWVNPGALVGFLVSYDVQKQGEVFSLRAGRIIVSNEPVASGNYLLIDDPTVSPQHAIMRISAGGEVQVLDQLSEHGTKILRFGADAATDLSGDKSSIEHGDVISFGNRSFHVCLIVKGEAE